MTAKKQFLTPARKAIYKICICLMLFQIFNQQTILYEPKAAVWPATATTGNEFLCGLFMFLSLVPIAFSAIFFVELTIMAEKQVKENQNERE